MTRAIGMPAAISFVLSFGLPVQAASPRTVMLDSWRFAVDAHEIGVQDQWFAPEHDDTGWSQTSIGHVWNTDVADDSRIKAWYRTTVHVPAEWRERTIYCGIERVHDSYELYVNGTLVREYQEKVDYLKQSTATAVHEHLRTGELNCIALAVTGLPRSGGATGRVVLTTEKRSLNWEPLRLRVNTARFRADPQARGLAQGWFRGDWADTNWPERTLSGDGWRQWEGLADYQGQAWYRFRLNLPKDWRGERITLVAPNVDGDMAMYMGNRPLMSRGFTHGSDVTRHANARELDTWPGSAPVIDITEALTFSDRDVLVVRVNCQGDRRGLRGPITLAADRRALIFDKEWKAVTELAKAEPELILPGWATGRGVTRTITGTIGGQNECFVAPDGSFSPSNRSYSMTLWVYDQDRNQLHAGERVGLDDLHQRLDGGRFPFPQSTWRAGEVKVDTTVLARSAKIAGAAHDLVFYRARLTNTGEDEIRLGVYAAITPFSITREYYAFARGYNPVRSIDYRPDWNAAIINDRLGVVALEKPTDFGCTSMVAGSTICEYARKDKLPQAHAVEDWAGLAGGAFRYELTLEPKKSRELHFVMPMDGIKPTPQAAKDLGGRSWKENYDAARKEWREVLDRKAIRITLPERDAQEAFYASLAYMLILKDGDALIPGSFAYNAFWTRDAAYLIDACLRAGLIETARKAVELWVGFQRDSGQFPSMGPGGPNEWDGQGQAMWAFVQVYRYSRDRDWLAKHFKHILQGARYIDEVRTRGLIEKNRDSARWGILTPSTSAEDLGPKDWHFYWDDFWCIRGLQDALYAARELNETAAAGEISKILESLQTSTIASIRRVMAESDVDWIPVAPESTSASGKARGTTPAVWPGGALEPDDPLVLKSFDHYWATLIAPKGGGYYHGGEPWPYATLELAHAYLNIGQPDRAYQMLRWTLDHQSAPGVYAWAEVADSRRKLFLGGDIPHGWGCAEYVSLVRDMLLREVDDALYLTSGVPPQWLDHGKRIEVSQARTPFGMVGYKLTSRAASDEITLDLDTEARPPGGVYWVVPSIDAPVEAVVLYEDDAVQQRTTLPSDRKVSIPAGVTRVVLHLKSGPADVMRDPYRARMQTWKQEMTDANLYASVDDRRPLLGVYFYFEGADARTNEIRLSSVREAFDFVQIGPSGRNVRGCEEAAVPWMGVDQPAIPLGRDSPQWSSARSVIRSRLSDYGDGYYLLGWNSGSEPHTSFKTPGYTGHSEKIYEDLGVAEPTRQEFLEWLAAAYGDDSPNRDSNGDGITFNQDFGLDLENWEDVTQPAHRRLPWFEHVLIPFTCKLIHDAEAGRLEIFRQFDPHHKVTPRLLRSLTDPRMSYDLTYLDLGDAAGVTFYCGGGFDMSDPHETGARVETRGVMHEGAFRFGIRMTPPHRNGSGVAQSTYRVFVPEGGPVLFRSKVLSDPEGIRECRLELVENLEDPESHGRLLARIKPAQEFSRLDVDLRPWSGRWVWLRLVADPGPARPPTDPKSPPRALWLEPRIEAGGRLACDLVEYYKEARAGYRLYTKSEPHRTDSTSSSAHPMPQGPFVFLGLRGSMYQVWYADHVMSLVANRARLAGKRAVANEFHPGSGSPHAMFPLAIYDSMIRLMQFKVPSVAYFCHMHQGQFSNYSMAHSEEHVARARNQAILWNAYPDVPKRRRAPVACFMPSNFATPQQADEAASRFGTKGHLVWAMGELGADFYLLNDLDQAADYDRIVVFLAYADQEAEEKLVTALTNHFSGSKVLILTGVSRLWGPVGARRSRRIDRGLAEWLPVSPVGGELVSRRATLLPGLQAEIQIADQVHIQDSPGFEPMKAEDGTVIGARSTNVMCLAGFPETPLADRLARGWFDTSLRRLVHAWLDVEPGLIDMGSIQIVNRDLVARAPAVYCIENSSCVTIKSGLVAYDVLHQHPAASRVWGPAVVRAWPAAQPRLVDTDVCEPLNVDETSKSISAILVSPSALRTSRPRRITFYWPGAQPEVRLDGEIVGPESLAETGFYRFDAPPHGSHELFIRGAAPAGRLR